MSDAYVPPESVGLVELRRRRQAERARAIRAELMGVAPRCPGCGSAVERGNDPEMDGLGAWWHRVCWNGNDPAVSCETPTDPETDHRSQT